MNRIVSLSLIAITVAMPATALADPAETVDAVMQADRDFAAMARTNGLGEAFRHYAADDARLVGANSEDTVGPNAIFEARQLTGDSVLAWDPRGGYAGEAGDFAVTYGDWGYFPDGDETGTPAATGGYITVWRLQDGAWRYVLDGGYTNTPQPPSDTTE